MGWCPGRKQVDRLVIISREPEPTRVFRLRVNKIGQSVRFMAECEWPLLVKNADPLSRAAVI